MGSWNQTCMLTQVPITYETKVKFFLLRGPRWHPLEGEERKDYGTTSGESYSHTLWQPYAPFDGVYNTYGAVEKWNAKDPLFVVVENYFQQKHKLKMKKVLDKIDEDKSFHLKSGAGANGCGLNYCYGFAMVPIQIYNGIVKANSERFDWRDKKHNVGDSYLTSVKKIIDIQKKDEEYAENKWLSFAQEGAGHAYHLLGETAHKKDLLKMMCDNEESIQDVVDFLVFQDAMQELRVGYMPQVGQGSQDTNCELHRMKANLAITYCCNEDARV
jgi:hypothetical protein